MSLESVPEVPEVPPVDSSSLDPGAQPEAEVVVDSDGEPLPPLTDASSPSEWDSDEATCGSADSSRLSSDEDEEDAKAFFKEMCERMAKKKESVDLLRDTGPGKPKGSRGRHLHLFSGPSGRSDGLAAFLDTMNCDCEEVDHVNNGRVGPTHHMGRQDLLNPKLWDMLEEDLKAGKFSSVGAGFP